MKVLCKKILNEFRKKYANARSSIQGWLAEAEDAQWQNTTDIKNRYPAVSFLPENVVIFNLKGNSYRLVAQVAYDTGIVFIRWIGTHAEYDKRYK
jgi:mRNA interferase HigB